MTVYVISPITPIVFIDDMVYYRKMFTTPNKIILYISIRKKHIEINI